MLKDREDSILDFAKGFFRHYTYRNGVENIISILNSLDIEKYKEIITIPITVMPCACKTMWDYVITLPSHIQKEYWTYLNVGVDYKEDAEFIVKKMIEYDRYDRALNIIYHSFYSNIRFKADTIEKAIIGILNSEDSNILSRMQYELSKVVYVLDKLEDANPQTLYSIEAWLYKLLEHYGDINDTRFIKEIMSNPESMMEIIDKTYISEDENERAKEIELTKNEIKIFTLLLKKIFE